MCIYKDVHTNSIGELEMKNVRLFTILVVYFLLFIIGTDIAKAQWSAIKGSGYAVTTNWHGISVPIGQVVVVTAGTTDPDVTHVRFIWRNSSEAVVWDETITIDGPLKTPNVPTNVPQEVIDWAVENQDITYWYAQSSHIPNALNEWSVQAIFYNATRPKGNSKVNFVIRATSFNVIPDAPVVGTAGLVLAMIFGLGLFKFKKNQQRRITSQNI